MDDAAFLADVTEFLDDFEASVQPDQQDTATELLQDSDQLLAETEALLRGSTNEPDSAQQLKEIRNVQAAKRRLKYQKKIKNERQILKEEEKILLRVAGFDELKELQRARKKAKALESQSLAAASWIAIAIRQNEGRLVAEKQNRRLKNAVENRAKVIEEIGYMMRERLYKSKSTLDIKMEKQHSVQLDTDDAVLFEEFLHDLDTIYPRTDEIFRSCGAEENPVMSYRLGPERKRDGDIEYIDNLDVLLIPFSFEQTCTTMWESMIRLYREKHRYHYDVADPENTIVVKLHVRVPRGYGEPVRMLVHLVMRRYIEDKRMVVVWRALSQGEGDFTGIHSDETGWCTVRPNESDEPFMRTVMQTFVRFIPMDITDTSDRGVDGYQFTKFVVSSVEEDGVEVARMMDSLLLEDSSDNLKS